MADIRLHSFRGKRPYVISEHLLGLSDAADCDDCIFESGLLKGIDDDITEVAADAGLANSETLYQYYTGAWYSFDDDTDIVTATKSATDEVIMYTDGINEPRFTTTALIGVGTGISAYRTVGITAPTAAPTAALNGAVDANPVYDTRSYVYTWVDSVSGAESAPSPASNIVTVDVVGQTIDLTVSTTAPVDGTYNIDKKRIYRTVTGTATTDLQFVAEINLAAANPYNDAADSLTLGEILTTTDYERPPLTMQGVTAHPAGFFVGFDGNTMCFSEPGFYYAWPLKYRFELEFPVVGIATIGGYVAVMTEGVPYLISGTSPYNMVPRKLDAYYPCVSKRSIVEMGGYCIYAAEDALVQITTNGAVSISRGILSREQWQDATPANIFGTRWRNLYLAIYPTYVDIWAPQALEVGMTTVNTVYKSVYVRPATGDTFFVNSANEIVNFAENTTSTATWSWKSKPFMFDTPVNFACIRTIGSFGGTITIEEDDTAPAVAADSYTYTTPNNALVNNTPIRLPSGIKYKGVRITINGGAGDEVQEIHLATSIGELPGTAAPKGQ